jgi:hypothetical protein
MLEAIVIALVHFLALLALPVATAFWCWRHFARPRLGRTLRGLAIVCLAFLLTIPAFAHHCGNGQPGNQALVPFLCALAVVVLVGRMSARVGAIAAIWAILLALSFTFNTAVHGPEWIGVRKYHGSLGSEEWHTSVTGLYRRNTPIDGD